MGPSMPPSGCVRLGSSLLSPDSGSFGPILPTRSFARLGSPTPAYGVTCFESSTFASDLIQSELLASLRAFICFGLAPPAYGLTCLGSSPSVADFVNSESTFSSQNHA